MEQCCSQGQNPKAKDEAKARTLKAEGKAWTLEAKTKTKAWTEAEAEAEAEAWILETKTKARRTLESNRPISRPHMTHNLTPIFHTPLTWRLHQSVSHSCLLIHD